jgi:phage-related protein
MIISIISAINWLNLGKEIITFIANGIKSLASQAPNIMKSIFEKAVEFIKNISWDATGKTVIAYLIGGIKGVGSMIANGLKQLFIDGVNAIKGIDWIGVGKNIIQGIVNGIKALGGQIKEVLLGLASSAFKGVKDFFGIHSPSRKMRDEIGKYIPEGMALGIRDHADDVIKAMDDLEQIPERYDSSIDFNGDSDYHNGRSGNSGGGNNNGGNTYIINVNQQVSTPDEMAQAIRVESQYGLIEGVPI